MSKYDLNLNLMKRKIHKDVWVNSFNMISSDPTGLLDDFFYWRNLYGN